MYRHLLSIAVVRMYVYRIGVGLKDACKRMQLFPLVLFCAVKEINARVIYFQKRQNVFPCSSKQKI
jgi:hypothetical protein